eukprot:scaffold8118_cov40-Phaeocystis_antarctica.AAC.1
MLRKVDDESVAMAWVHGHGAAGWGAWGGMIDAWGCRLRCMGRQAGAHGAAGWGAWDCRLGCMGLQAGVRGVTRWSAWGCRLRSVGLQAVRVDGGGGLGDERLAGAGRAEEQQALVRVRDGVRAGVRVGVRAGVRAE